MAIQYETLALTYAPELYYVDSGNPLHDVGPEDGGGLYWRVVESSVSWADVCIQYIAYFTRQRWVPTILDTFSGKLPGEHPNDYVPLFIYFKNGKPVRVVFDICHYEAIGAINAPSPLLPQDRRSKFLIKYFYRGLVPLKEDKEVISLHENVYRLIPERLDGWWRGVLSGDIVDEKAKLIIKQKLLDPFKVITTFRDHAGKLGFLFHLIFQSAKDYQIRGLSVDVDKIALQVGQTSDAKGFSHQDIEKLTEFVGKNIFEKSQIPEYLALRGYKKFQRV